MSDEASPVTEAAPQAPSGAKVRLLGPNNVVYAVDAESASAYEQHGYTRYSGPTLDEGSIAAKFASWRDKVAGPLGAAGIGAINQIPFLGLGLSKVAPGAAKSLGEATADARKEHGSAYAAGSVGGALGSFAVGGAAVKGTATALKLGSKLPALAALAESSPVVTAAVTGAASNAAFNVADQFDSQALEHAVTPEGQEKLAFSYGRLAAAAGIGAVLPAAVGGLVKGTGQAARGVHRWARSHLLGDFIDEADQAALRQVGKGHVLDLAQSLTERGQGSEEYTRELSRRIKSADTRLAEIRTTTRDHAMTLEEAKTARDAVLQHLGETNLPRDDIRPLTDAIDSHDALSLAETELAAVRARVKLARDGGVMNAKEMETALKDPLSKVAEARKNLKELPRDQQLQEMAKSIYKRLDPANPLETEHYMRYLQSGRELAAARDALHLRVSPQTAGEFRSVRNELSDHLALAEATTKRHIPAVMEGLRKAEASAAVAGSMAALGLRGGSILGSAGSGAAMAMMYYGGTRSIAASANFVARHLSAADGRLATAIKLGLYGTSAPRVAFHPYDFQNQAARVKAAQRDPVTSMAKMHESLIDDGMPEHIADKVAPRLHSAVQASAQALPKRQTSPDLASAAQPDLHQQRAWMSETRSRLDPTYALAYPTTQNMKAAKQHHPENIARAQEAVMEALHENPYLPLASRMWAARVLGRSAGGLTSPTFYQSLSQMRAKADAEAQQGQGAPSSQRGNAPSAVAQSEQTRLGELSTP